MTTKLVYKDDRTTKILWGKIIEEDSVFIHFLTSNGNKFRVNKHNIITIKQVGEDGSS